MVEFYNQLIKKEEGCHVFVLPGPSSVLGRALLTFQLIYNDNTNLMIICVTAFVTSV